MGIVQTRLINQCKYQNQTVVSATFDKQGEDGLMLDEIVLWINLIFNQNLAENHINFFVKKFPSENQIKNQQTKDSDWGFDENSSMTICLY